MQRSDWYSDTDPRTLEVFLECQRRMTASEKVQGMLELTRMVFETAQAEVRHLDRDTMIRVYGWDPESAGA
jgi:hypothetical protein